MIELAKLAGIRSTQAGLVVPPATTRRPQHPAGAHLPGAAPRSRPPLARLTTCARLARRRQKLVRLTTTARPPRAARRRTCTCTSRGRCGTRRCSSSPSATASRCPTRWSRTGRRSCRRPTRRAGSASSGSTTWRGRCCAPRTTYAAWCGRPPRTTSATAGAGWRSRSTRAGTPPASAGSPRSPTWCSTRARRRRSATGLGIAVVIAANRTRHPLDARTLARLAGAVRRPRRRRLRAVQRRAARHAPPTSRRPSRSPSGPGCCWSRTAASCSGPSTSGPASTPCTPTGSATASARPRTRRCSTGSSSAGVALEVCPVSNVALGVYSDLTSVPLPHAARRPARPSRSAPTTRCCSAPGSPASTPPCAPPTTSPTTQLAELARMSVRASRAPDDVQTRLLAEIDAWLACLAWQDPQSRERPPRRPQPDVTAPARTGRRVGERRADRAAARRPGRPRSRPSPDDVSRRARTASPPYGSPPYGQPPSASPTPTGAAQPTVSRPTGSRRTASAVRPTPARAARPAASVLGMRPAIGLAASPTTPWSLRHRPGRASVVRAGLAWPFAWRWAASGEDDRADAPATLRRRRHGHRRSSARCCWSWDPGSSRRRPRGSATASTTSAR